MPSSRLAQLPAAHLLAAHFVTRSQLTPFKLSVATRAALAAISAGIMLPGPATAGEGLRVMSLDVSNAPTIQAPAAQTPEKPSWRTSFGSQRETRDVPAGPVPGLDADIVLLQGVRNLRAVHRAFPGRTWRLVVSRQMVLTDDPVDPRSYEAVTNEPSTAVAVRYQPGLRVAGQDHFMGLRTAEPEPGSAGNLGASNPAGAGERFVAGTAVRLNLGGRFVWLASVAFAADCAHATKPCAQREALNVWRQGKLTLGEAVITGGLHVKAQPEAGPLPACPDQTVSVAPARKDAAPWIAYAEQRDGLGCAVLADASGQPPQ